MKTLKTNLKIKLYKIIFTILILSGVVTIILIGIKYLGDYKIEKENKEILETFSKTDFSDLEVETQETEENYTEAQKLRQVDKSNATTLKQRPLFPSERECFLGFSVICQQSDRSL